MTKYGPNFLLIIVATLYLCIRPSFGIGEPAGIKEMIEKSDAICCGVITGLKITDEDAIGSNNCSRAVSFEFAVDHLIKGSIGTNVIVVLCKRMDLSEDMAKEIERTNSEVVPSLCRYRLMLFLAIEKREPLTFRRLPGLNAEVPVAAISPNRCGGESDGIDASIEIELVAAIGSAKDATKKHLQSLLDTWEADRQHVSSRGTNSQEIIQEP